MKNGGCGDWSPVKFSYGSLDAGRSLDGFRKVTSPAQAARESDSQGKQGEGGDDDDPEDATGSDDDAQELGGNGPEATETETDFDRDRDRQARTSIACLRLGKIRVRRSRKAHA